MTSATQVLGQSVVVFSKNYLPVSRVNIKRTMTLIITSKAEPLDFTNGTGTLMRYESVCTVRSEAAASWSVTSHYPCTQLSPLPKSFGANSKIT